VGYTLDEGKMHPAVWKEGDTAVLVAVPRQKFYWTFQVMCADEKAFASTGVLTMAQDGVLGIWPADGGVPQLVPWKGYSLIRPYDLCKGQVVGYANPARGEVPAVRGFVYTGGRFVVLDSPEFKSIVVRTTDGTHQFGEGTKVGEGATAHPLMWNTSAAHPVDFLPAGKKAGAIAQARGTLKVGTVDGHAAVWTGGPGTYRDVHPAGFAGSAAAGTNGKVVVGWVEVGDGAAARSAGAAASAPARVEHAVVWVDFRAVDLHGFLPAGFTSSTATCVDGAGNILGTARGDKREVAVVWSPE
jgi:hypothetical protein